MTDVAAAGAQKFNLPGIGEIGTILARRPRPHDRRHAILVVLILPLPPMLLDIALAMSITFRS